MTRDFQAEANALLAADDVTGMDALEKEWIGATDAPPPFDPEAALAEWRDERAALDAATAAIDATMAAINAQIAELQIERDLIALPYYEELERLETAIRDHALETGRGWKVDGAAVGYRKGYEKVTWDGKRLDGYAAAHPEIVPFRSVTMVAPSVTVKLA